MKCLFIITPHQDIEHAENLYLLIIAMLNFDFPVTLVFDATSFKQWQTSEQLNQYLVALHMYGIKQFHILSSHRTNTTENKTAYIDHATFEQMKSAADFIL